MPSLHKLDLSGVSTCSVSGFDTRAGITFNVSGKSTLTADNMTAGDMVLKVSNTSKVTGNFTAGDVKLKCSGASTVVLFGIANDLSCNASSSSQLKMDAFALGNAKVILGDESIAAIKPSGKLDVQLSNASKLTYYGDPVLVETQIERGSTMTRK